MKALLLILWALTGTLYCSAQTAAQTRRCKVATDKPSLAPYKCASIARHVAWDERISRVSHDGDSTTIFHGNTKEHRLSGRLQSAVFLDTMRMYYGELEELARTPPQMSIYATVEEADFILNLWPTARDGFCNYHPGETYTELSNIEAVCPEPVRRISSYAGLRPRSLRRRCQQMNMDQTRCTRCQLPSYKYERAARYPKSADCLAVVTSK